MQLGTSRIVVNFETSFIPYLDKWKKLFLLKGIKNRLRELIEEDLKRDEKND